MLFEPSTSNKSKHCEDSCANGKAKCCQPRFNLALNLRSYFSKVLSELGIVALAMDDELKEILKDNEVCQPIQDFLTASGCTTVKKFADWVDDQKDLEDSVLKASQVPNLSRKDKASVVGAWRDATAINSRRLKRLADNVQDSHAEEPLSEMAQRAIDETFLNRYHVEIQGHLRPSDSLLGKLRREMERNLPTFIPLSKVKSAFVSTRMSESKKHKAGEVSIVLGSDPDPAPSTRYRDVMLRLEVLANGWALAGCFTAPNGQQLMCELQDAQRYHRYIKDRTESLLDSYTEPSVTSYVIAVEECLRGHALDMTRRRDSPTKWGEALTQVLLQYPIAWSDNMNILIPKVSQLHSQGVASIASSSGQNAVNRGRVATCTHTSKGKPFCKSWNDSRGCKEPCKQGRVHACDLQLQGSGKACEKRHTRGQHDPSKDGTPATRPNL